MSTPARPERFPCPFCGGNRVRLTGGSQTFLHYLCAECAEVWTAMAGRMRPDPVPRQSVPRGQKN